MTTQVQPAGQAPAPPAKRAAQGGTLKLDRLMKRYGDVTAVEEVDLTLEPGELLTLLGPSGSGKTTTLLMVAGFEQPTSGEVLVDGQAVTSLPPHKRNIGMVFQHYALFPHMTVADNVAFPLRMRDVPRDEVKRRVEESLALVHLAGYGGRYPHELSGGQQQRVALARATVFGPPLLLMDEPLGALDKHLRGEMQREIKRIHRDLGTSVVCVTHDQEEALALSDRIALMNEGRVEQVGTAQEIYERPCSLFAARFLGESNVVGGEVASVRDDGVVEVALGEGAVVAGTPARPVTRGQKVVVVTRPERLVPHLPDSAETNGHRGLRFRIDEVVFLGDRLRCHGTFATGDPCMLVLDAHAGREIVAAGQGVATWPAGDAVILPES
jgi:putative spermidine/putrescine transport system ATP-binding protein